MATDPLIALGRFGLGPRPGEWQRIKGDPRGYVQAQLAAPGAALVSGEGLISTADAMRTLLDLQAKEKRAKEAVIASMAGAAPSGTPAAKTPEALALVAFTRGTFHNEISARVIQGVRTDAALVERLVLFWSNHFCVTTDRNNTGRVTAGALEREAIRPHVLGRFRDMLGAAVTHVAMLAFLNNKNSYGPNSRAARTSGRGLNENLGRELLELHTLGVNGGYTQADIVQLALVLTGWTYKTDSSPDAGIPVFAAKLHEPGSKTILGKTYPDAGEAQLGLVLDDLARHPSTARHIAQKLARQFVADDASDDLVGCLAARFLETDGDLAAVAGSLVEADEAWTTPRRKIIPPYDYVIAAGRAFDFVPEIKLVQQATQMLGQRIMSPPSPAGWPGGDESWLAGNTLLERLDIATAIADKFAPAGEVGTIVDQLFGSSLNPLSRQELLRAESRKDALALALMLPELQRR